MATTFEKTWQCIGNILQDTASTANQFRSCTWSIKQFLKGDLVYNTYITSASNGTSLPQSTINVNSTLGFPASGTISVLSSAGSQLITYTGTTANTFTGCTGGTGTLTTGNMVFTNYLTAITTQATSLQGLWTMYYSCDGTNVGSAGDGIDRWGSLGGSTGISGSAASITTGATITGAVRLTGLSGMTQADVGNLMVISGAATSANNSPTNTPFKIVNFISSSSVDILNPNGTTTDANNGAISWAVKNIVPIAQTTIASGSNGNTLPQSTINVTSTAGFPSSGIIWIITSSAVSQMVTYTGVNGTQFTGCSGGTGSLSTGNQVMTHGAPNWNTSGAHSWFVMKSPSSFGTGPFYYTVDLNTSQGIITVLFSKSAPTGGTTSSRPTSPDEVALTSWGNNSGSNTGNTNNTTTQHRFHGAISTDGGWHWMTSFDGNGQFYCTNIMHACAETKAGDTYNAYMYMRGGNTGPVFGQLQNNSGYYAGRNRNGQNSVLANATNYCFSTSSGATFVNFLTTTDYADGTFDDMPIYVYNQIAGYKSIRGRMIDYRWCGNNLPNGAIESSQTNPTSIVNGNLWMPYFVIPIL